MNATLPHLQPYTKSSGLLSYASSCVTHTTYHEPQQHTKTEQIAYKETGYKQQQARQRKQKGIIQNDSDSRQIYETRTRRDYSLLRHPRPQDERRAAKARRDNEGTVNLSSQSHKPGGNCPGSPADFGTEGAASLPNIDRHRTRLARKFWTIGADCDQPQSQPTASGRTAGSQSKTG